VKTTNLAIRNVAHINLKLWIMWLDLHGDVSRCVSFTSVVCLNVVVLETKGRPFIDAFVSSCVDV